jgi:hypothetical protein
MAKSNSLYSTHFAAAKQKNTPPFILAAKCRFTRIMGEHISLDRELK